jgi:hypothetical protein
MRYTRYTRYTRFLDKPQASTHYTHTTPSPPSKSIQEKPHCEAGTHIHLPIRLYGYTPTPPILYPPRPRAPHARVGWIRYPPHLLHLLSCTCPSWKQLEAQHKLEVLNTQLADLRAQKRANLAHGHTKLIKDGRMYAPKTEYNQAWPTKNFSHPKLEYIYGQIVYSPYRTPPGENYPKTTFSVPGVLKAYSQNGIRFDDIPDSEKPYSPVHLKKVVSTHMSYIPLYPSISLYISPICCAFACYPPSLTLLHIHIYINIYIHIHIHIYLHTYR